MDKPPFDVAISGAGPAGSALALLLARYSPDPARIALIDSHFATSGSTHTAQAHPPATVTDPRILALNHGSRQVLEDLGAWPQVSATIHTVHVSQSGRLGQTLIRHADYQVPQLGNVASYHDLRLSLHAQLEKSGITLVRDRFVSVQSGPIPQLQLASQTLACRLLVQSGGASPEGFSRHYHQQALTCTIRASQPRAGWAYERFTRQGPLALLPHPDGPDRYGIVWCCEPARAQQLAEAGPDEFTAALHALFGERLGTLKLASKRHVLDLALHVGPVCPGGPVIAIGNAAQTLHPVAGQGFNLGLRDAVQLAQFLAPWLAKPTEPLPPLQQFASQRSSDRWLTASLTDFLSRIFATGKPLVEHAGGLALLATDLCAPLRQPLARHLLHGWRS